MQRAGLRAIHQHHQRLTLGGKVSPDRAAIVGQSTGCEAGLQEFQDPSQLTGLCDLVNQKMFTVLLISTLQ